MTHPGDFSSIAKTYAEARRDVPEAVLRYVFSLLAPSPSILDLGCGTGISTRQLKEFTDKVIGADKYSAMIEEAKKYGDDIEYLVAPAEKMPLVDQSFDVITAFSAFHWFSNEEATREIKRLLKSGGLFVAVNRYDKDNFRSEAISMLRAKSGQSVEVYKNVAATMDKLGFQNITERRFSAEERYSLGQGIELIKSSSWWAMVPDELKPEAEKDLTLILGQRAQRGELIRSLDFVVVSGK